MSRHTETLRTALRWLLAAAYAIAGTAHISAPAPFLAITPGWVPFAPQIIFVTGICELLGAAGLLIPRTRRAAGMMLALYAVCVYPANVQHMLNDIGSGAGLGWAYHGPRLLFQPVIVWWCLFAGNVVHWPFAAQARRG